MKDVDEMINELVEARMENLELDLLEDYAKEALENQYKQMPFKEFKEEYDFFVGDVEEDPDAKPFTVLLLYPDFMSEDWPYETYQAQVEAPDVKEAIHTARIDAAAQNVEELDPYKDVEEFMQLAYSFAPLAVYEGFVDDICPHGSTINQSEGDQV